MNLPSGNTILHYRLLEQIGQGGMGVVYKAYDIKLKRDVAIKFLPRQIAASQQELERFKTEAQAAAALNHPNIATIYTIEEHDDETRQMPGSVFIVMEYIEGRELKEIVGAPLVGAQKRAGTGATPTINEILSYATQIASGLQAAHEKGVIHRDIKSSNIMITEKGQVKIMDFGLAKIAGRTQLTKDHSTLGTSAYMSPEQARAERVDHRTDIWSLGVVLYEMVSGQLPFQGDKEPAVLYAILMRDYSPLSELNPKAPIDLERIIDRALTKDADKRYQVMDKMLQDLDALKQSIAAGHVEKDRGIRLRWLRKKRVLLYSSVAALLVLLLTVGLFNFISQRNAIASLAVLPFSNIGADPDTEYLSDGMSESLIRSLSQLPNLKVMSFNIVSRYKKGTISAQEIGSELDVQAVLVGRVGQRDNTLDISVELVNTRDSRHIWGEQYHRNLNDLLLVQNEITDALTTKLQPDLTVSEKKYSSKRHTQNLEAYQLYLKGRFHTAKYTKEGMERGIDYFKQAIHKDSSYALAYDGLAYSYIIGFEWLFSPREALPKAKEAAINALALDESLAEAHASLGAVYFYYEWDWPAAEREFKRAIELNLNYATTYQYYAPYLVARGRLDEAIAVSKRAYEIEPLSPESNTYLGWIYSLAGQNDPAWTHLNNALEIDPNFWFARMILAGVYEGKGQLKEAGEELKKASSQEGEFSEALASLGRFYAKQGQVAAAREVLQELKRRAEKNYVPPHFFFTIHSALGEKDEALQWFEAAFEERCVYLLWDKVFMYADLQRSDPRLVAILDKVGVRAER